MNDIKVPVDKLVAPATALLDNQEILDSQLEEDLELVGEPNDNDVAIQVTFDEEVEPIEIKEIVDAHGRLSDIIDSLEDAVGLSVIPLKMANIAPEVSRLQRHEIFTFGGERYAFSNKIRQNVCDRYLAQITKTISEGVPYQLDLVTTITWRDKVYTTLLLSRVEWTYIMSKCRGYKQTLTTDQKTQITLKVFAERI